MSTSQEKPHLSRWDCETGRLLSETPITLPDGIDGIDYQIDKDGTAVLIRGRLQNGNGPSVFYVLDVATGLREKKRKDMRSKSLDLAHIDGLAIRSVTQILKDLIVDCKRNMSHGAIQKERIESMKMGRTKPITHGYLST